MAQKAVAMIGEEAKKTLEKNIGLPLSQVNELSSFDESLLVSTKTGRGLKFSKDNDPRKTGRGNPLLARKKITTIEEINSKIDAL